MALLEQRGDKFRIGFRIRGEMFRVNLKATEPKEADGCHARLEENLQLFERGRLEVPPGAELGPCRVGLSAGTISVGWVICVPRGIGRCRSFVPTRTAHPRPLSCGITNRAKRRNDDAGLGRPSPSSTAVQRRGPSGLPRCRGSEQPERSSSPTQGHACRTFHKVARGFVTKTRSTVRRVTPSIKRVIVSLVAASFPACRELDRQE